MVFFTIESKKFQVDLMEIAYLSGLLKKQLALLLILKEQRFWFEGKVPLFPEQFQQHHLDKLINHVPARILALMVYKIPYW